MACVRLIYIFSIFKQSTSHMKVIEYLNEHVPWTLLWQLSINFNLFLRTLNVPVLKIPTLCVNKRPKDTTKEYGWLHLHCTYNYLRCWKNLASSISDASLSLPEAVWPRESEIGEKGVGTRLLWPFTIPPCFELKSCSRKTKTFGYPLHLFDLKQNYANRKTKLRISKHFCSILGRC